ncbi:RNA polymerase sigma factor [Flectobacillus major]|uniref:RNA polymerase sigma factor n=1 Tax=Flectobacillus major TaxID=103 RepID=UPI000409C2C7|nr:RNA polymerase sigma factor [Flectobacillus major]
MFFKKKHTEFDKDNLESVLQACREQHPEAQKVLFKMYFSYAKNICQRYAANQEDAEEILNDGFMKVFQNIHRYENIQSFKAWFRTILVNTSINYYHKREKNLYSLEVEHVSMPVYDENVIDKMAAEDILALVQKLPTSYRTVFMMHVVDGYNHREIAEMLGINEGTSRSNFMKARLKLQEMIKTYYPHLFAVSLTNKLYEN